MDNADLKAQFEKMENLKKSQEYDIYNRFISLDFVWNLCKDNEDELFSLFNLVEKTINMEVYNIYDNIIKLLTRRIINHVGTIFLMKEYMTKENKFLESQGKCIIGYKKKIHEHFACNSNIQFVHYLRNHVIHNRMIKPEIESHIINDKLNISLLILKTKTLLESNHWNSCAKKYIMMNEPKINIKTCLIEYSKLQEELFIWFKNEYRKKYTKEITHCEKIICDLNIIIENKRKEFENMSIDQIMSLPSLICNSENGFTITRVD
jgi:hypothetical protein